MTPATAPPEVTVILPTFNERENLPRVIAEIHNALRAIPHEILVVDDNSPDGTWQWVESALREDAALRLVRRLRDPGLSPAILEGFGAARSPSWIVMDADGQHDPSVLPRMIEALTHHELVVGSRYASGGSTGRWTPIRWLTSRIATWLAQLILNVVLSDPMSGYFGVRKEAYERIASRMNPRGFKMLLELYYRLSRQHSDGKVSVLEVPFQFRRRLAGQSKLSTRVMGQYVSMLVRLRREESWPQGLPKFLCVGALGTVVNCAVLGVLTHQLHWHYLLASLLAIEVSIVFNFLLHDAWTFRDRRQSHPWSQRLWRYQVTSLAGMGVNWIALAILVGLGRWPLVIANLCGIVAGTFLNFAISKLWTWKRQPEPIAHRTAEAVR